MVGARRAWLWVGTWGLRSYSYWIRGISAVEVISLLDHNWGHLGQSGDPVCALDTMLL
jgi:hypothetical protein